MKNKAKEKRIKRVRAKIRGSDKRPRLTVFRSNKYVYAQLINDQKGNTLFSASEKEILEKVQTKVARAKLVGQLLAQKALGNKIKQVVFDRHGNKYHGRVKALSEGARTAGLEF